MQATVRTCHKCAPDAADCDIEDIVRRAASRRVRIDPLSWCYTEPDCAPPGLILGYANLTESQIDTGVRAIAAAVGRSSQVVPDTGGKVAPDSGP